MRLKTAVLAATLAAAPFAAQAVPVHQLDIVGNLNPSTSTYTPTGEVDFLGFGTATSATGIFSPVITIEEAQDNPLEPTVFNLFDIEFEEPAPQLIYSSDDFSFYATSFLNFDNDLPGRAFDALGFITTISGQLPGEFSLSSQVTDLGQTLVSFSSTTTVVPVPASLLLLLSSIMGLGWLSHRRRPATA